MSYSAFSSEEIDLGHSHTFTQQTPLTLSTTCLTCYSTRPSRGVINSSRNSGRCKSRFNGDLRKTYSASSFLLSFRGLKVIVTNTPLGIGATLSLEDLSPSDPFNTIFISWPGPDLTLEPLAYVIQARIISRF